jgi:hypothetical protein
MADQKVSELASASTGGGANLLYIVQGGVSKKITLDVLAALIQGGSVGTTSYGIKVGYSGAHSVELSADFANDITGVYLDSTQLQLYSTRNVQIYTDANNAIYAWLFNQDGTTTLPTPGYVPSYTTSTGVKGQVSWDSGHIYVCVDTNTWRRANLATW